MTDKETPFEKELRYQVTQLRRNLPCCPNCEHWDEKDELCGQVEPSQRPPAPVIAFGCPSYSPAIPF